MKRLFFPLLLLAATTSHAQLFKDLLDKAKEQLASTVSKHANRIIDEGTDYLDGKASKVSIVSSKTKVVNRTPTYASSATKEASFKADTSSLIAPSEVDKYLSETFPRFYMIYKHAVATDSLIKQVQFGYRDGHKLVCSASKSGGGTIFFDLSFFETKVDARQEGRFVYDFFVMEGLMHSYATAGNDKVALWKTAFEFALARAEKSAERGYCVPLRCAMAIIKLRLGQDETKLTGSNANMVRAHKQVAQGDTYKECVAWLASNGSTCKPPTSN